MKLFFTFDNFKQNYFNFLLALLPISFIAGNLIININVILIIFSAILFYRKKVFSLKYLLIDKLIFSYFFLIIFTGVFNDFQLQIYHEKIADSRGHFYTTMKFFIFKILIILFCFEIFNRKE